MNSGCDKIALYVLTYRFLISRAVTTVVDDNNLYQNEWVLLFLHKSSPQDFFISSYGLTVHCIVNRKWTSCSFDSVI